MRRPRPQSHRHRAMDRCRRPAQHDDGDDLRDPTGRRSVDRRFRSAPRHLPGPIDQLRLGHRGHRRAASQPDELVMRQVISRRALAVGLITLFAAVSGAVVLLFPLFAARYAPAPTARPHQVVSGGILVSNFNDLRAWTYDASHGMEEGGGTALAGRALEGSAIRLTTPHTAGSSAWMTQSGLQVGITEAGTFSFWVDIADAHRIESITFYASADETFTKYFATSIDVTGELAPGPQMVAISVREMQAHGGMTLHDPVTTVQLRISSRIGSGEATFDHLYYERRASPQIVISFDDNWLTQYTEAFPFMAQRGVPGTIYAIQETINLDRYMSLRDLKTVYAAGWDIANHTTDHMGFNSDASRVPLMWGRKLFLLARPQVPNLRLALNGDLSRNGSAVLSPPRIVVLRVERAGEAAEAVKTAATIVGLDRAGQVLTETIPITAFASVATNNVFAEVQEITFAESPQARVSAGVAQAGDTSALSLIDCARYLVANGMPRGADHVAYPLGERNRVTDRAMAEILMKTGRTVTGRSTPTTDGLINPFTIQAFSPHAHTPLSALTGMVDMAIEHGATTFVVFHRLEKNPSVPTDYAVGEFRAFIDYVVRKRDAGLIEPTTISRWFEALPNKAGIPVARSAAPASVAERPPEP
ncbi:hypothetical protein C0214_07240 [Methylobacterium sp. DM1]|nr:hypothetical protein C0214_07240 [Methylobacterium sp. DM1]